MRFWFSTYLRAILISTIKFFNFLLSFKTHAYSLLKISQIKKYFILYNFVEMLQVVMLVRVTTSIFQTCLHLQHTKSLHKNSILINHTLVCSHLLFLIKPFLIFSLFHNPHQPALLKTKKNKKITFYPFFFPFFLLGVMGDPTANFEPF